MRKVTINFIIFFACLLITFSVVSSLDLEKVSSDGYKCLEKKIEDTGCSKLSLEDQVFSYLSAGYCKKEMLESAKEEGCFGASKCDLKLTAQAIIALNSHGENVSLYTDWMKSKEKINTETNWFLQLISSSETNCTIKGEDDEFSFRLESNEKLTSTDISECYEIDEFEYKIKIDTSCYKNEFKVSCDKDFSTSLLFQNANSNTIDVLNNAKSATAGKEILEKVESYCISPTGSCRYEDNLWATMALGLTENDASRYLPYLISGIERYPMYMPEVFLYSLTSDDDYAADIKSKQKSGNYWLESGGRFFSTGLALLPFSGEEFEEKTKALEWLEKIQDKKGCWEDENIKSTSMILFANWPRKTEHESIEENQTNITVTTKPTCASEGFTCMLDASCKSSGGSNLGSKYECSGINICCDKTKELPTCASVGGTFCKESEKCTKGIAKDISDYSSLSCCLGACELESVSPEPISKTCDSQFGTCSDSCEGKSTEIEGTCDGEQVCCVKEERKSNLLLWGISALIIMSLVALLVIKLRKKKEESKDSKSQSNQQLPGARPPFTRMPNPQRRVQGRPMPIQNQQQRNPSQGVQNPQQVLNRLRAMSK